MVKLFRFFLSGSLACTFLLMCSNVVEGRAQTSDQLEVLQVRPNVYMIAGAGGNVAVQIGSDGVIVVDTGTQDQSDAVLSAIRKLTDRPIRFVINTGPDPDHVGANERVSRAGRTIFQTANPLGSAMTNEGAATIIAAENVLFRMSAPTGQQSPYAAAAWPTDTFDGKRMYMYFNGEGVEILHQPLAHSDGDSIVFLRRSDVIVAGDILDTTRFPVIDVDKGGSIDGEIEALNRLIELAIPPIPLFWQGGGTYVIPGHGRICDQTDVVEYRDMVVIIRDRIQAMINEGLTLEQLQTANPTQGYSRRYGSSSGSWTTSMFVEAVYKSLMARRTQR
jgi:cyclase